MEKLIKKNSKEYSSFNNEKYSFTVKENKVTNFFCSWDEKSFFKPTKELKNKNSLIKHSINKDYNHFLLEMHKLIQLDAVTKNTYSSVETFYGKILEIEEDSVLVKYCLDKDNKVFQMRRLDITPLIGAIELTMNNFIEIKVYTRSGERKYIYKNADKKITKTIFEEKNYFEGLENSSFFNPK